MRASALPGAARQASGFYTDKASLFQTAPKNPPYAQALRDAAELPPTQIGRALRELSIVWIGVLERA